MPELPDITVYIEALEERLLGHTLENIRISSPFLLRSVEPPLASSFGRKVTGFRRLGKRIAISLEGDLWLVIHLMIAGRLHWKKRGTKPPGKVGLASFDFDNGTLVLTEAASRKQASLQLTSNPDGLNPGGLEPLTATLDQFRDALLQENHTLKRALTDSHLFSGIGNAYSDEILHAARLSPVILTSRLTPDQIQTLYTATQRTLQLWIERLRQQTAGGFPEKVTAFRPEMAVHGRYKLPCPVCGSPVQRIRYASNECNYCATCQTQGKLLSDRGLARLMKQDWPRTIEELERRVEQARSTNR
jgi:formamidopyrimidine-DNA glycosylase